MQEEESKPIGNNSTKKFTDVLGLGEMWTSVTKFFTSLIERLPFNKLTGGQTFILTMFLIIIVFFSAIVIINPSQLQNISYSAIFATIIIIGLLILIVAVVMEYIKKKK